MRLSTSSDYRYCATPDGAIWTDGPCHYEHWTRYLSVFEHVNVLARVKHVSQAENNLQRADGAGVSFSPLPYYLGLWQYLRQARRIIRAAGAAIGPDDAVILNVPGQIASCFEPALGGGRPFGVQVLGDPFDVLAPGVMHHPLRPPLRWWCTTRLRRQARRAAGALYVTQSSLQRRYPCPARTFGVSDVDLPPDAFRPFGPPPGSARPFTLVSVGSMAVLHKGHDVLIDALGQLSARGQHLRLVLVGDGQYRPLLQQRARDRGIAQQVEFLGSLPAGARVREVLDTADLFVFPSRAEGLPRALLEAMARSLPCLASRVGGIPELLDDEDLLPPGDAVALSGAIHALVGDAPKRARMSRRNFEKALEYQAEGLQQRRQAFFRHVAQCTAQWLAQSRPAARAASLASGMQPIEELVP